MPKRLKLTRRVNLARPADAWRTRKTFRAAAGLAAGEALSFLFENFSSVMDEDNLTHRLRIFNSELEARKK
jgi:hypothetical protein